MTAVERFAIRVIEIQDGRNHLDDVKVLHRANASTLGMFPAGAFEDHAERGTILLAMNDANECVGYLLYRIARNRVSIVHLCVAGSVRGKGVGRRLVTRLVELTKHTAGITLKCRPDYEANALWPTLGFERIGEVVGRSGDGKKLVRWWLSHRHDDLFRQLAVDKLSTKIPVVIDANVLYDLDDDQSRGDASRALLADWLLDEVELFVTSEVDNELARCNDREKLERSRRRADTLPRLQSTYEGFRAAKAELRPRFPSEMDEQTQSDLHQLAHAVSGSARYFVTRDRPLTRLADAIAERYGLMIMEPGELIVHIDELQHGYDYYPGRLNGSDISIRLVNKSDIGMLASRFRQHHERERELRRAIIAHVSSPEVNRSELVSHGDTDVALIVHRLDVDGETLTVSSIRVRDQKQAPTWWRLLLRYCVTAAVENGRSIVLVAERALPREAETALSDLGFFVTDGGWAKVALPGAFTAAELAERVQAVATHPVMTGADLAGWPAQIRAVHDPVDIVEHEHRLWPAKITDCEMDAWIVPIRACWARELFDHRLADGWLIARPGELVMNHESVYYRSAKGGPKLAPARLLWYIAKEGGADGTGCIAACSILIETVTDTAKPLFRRFRRLGVYGWDQVYKTANHNLDEAIMALRFTDTELLPTRIAVDRVNEIVEEIQGRTNNFVSPVKIEQEAFVKLYREATRSST